MPENLSRVGLIAERGESRHHRQGYRRHRQELEQTGIYRSDEVHQPVEPCYAQHSQCCTDYQCTDPKQQLLCLLLVVFSFCYIVHGVISIQVRYNLRSFKFFVLYDRRSVMRTAHSSFCHGRAVRDAPQAC